MKLSRIFRFFPALMLGALSLLTHSAFAGYLYFEIYLDDVLIGILEYGTYKTYCSDINENTLLNLGWNKVARRLSDDEEMSCHYNPAPQTKGCHYLYADSQPIIKREYRYYFIVKLDALGDIWQLDPKHAQIRWSHFHLTAFGVAECLPVYLRYYATSYDDLGNRHFSFDKNNQQAILGKLYNANFLIDPLLDSGWYSHTSGFKFENPKIPGIGCIHWGSRGLPVYVQVNTPMADSGYNHQHDSVDYHGAYALIPVNPSLHQLNLELTTRFTFQNDRHRFPIEEPYDTEESYLNSVHAQFTSGGEPRCLQYVAVPRSSFDLDKYEQCARQRLLNRGPVEPQQLETSSAFTKTFRTRGGGIRQVFIQSTPVH
ncbi:hypothetical protein [Spongorhabdus nitratireducens]